MTLAEILVALDSGEPENQSNAQIMAEAQRWQGLSPREKLLSRQKG